MKPKFLSVFAVVAPVLAAAALPCGLASAETLSWSEAVQEARKYNPGLASARESIEQAKADRTTAASFFWPEVAADASAGTSETRASGSRPSDRFSYGISARQLLFDGFRSVYDVEIAVDLVEAAGYGYRVSSSDVRFSLRRAYVNLWRAQELVRITERIAERRLQSDDLIQLRYDAGREHRGSLLTAEANLDQARFEVERARRNLVVAQRALIRELGREAFAPVEVPEEEGLPSASAERPDFEALAIRTPFLQQLLVQKEAARWGVRSARADFFPSVYANASMGRSGPDWPESSGWSSDWAAGATASVTFFDGWAQWANVARAQAARRSAEADARGGRDSVLVTLEETWAGWQNAVTNARVQGKFLEAARERARIAEAEYGTGLITFNDWIIIENNLVQADKAYLDARADAWIAEAQWRQAKGETLDDEQV